MKKVAIVILHFGDRKITQKLIVSLEKYEIYPYSLIVVNNTQENYLPKDFSKKKITIINNHENKGFAGGVNGGIRRALKDNFDAVLLLNNDTIIQKPFLGNLVKTLYSQDTIGIVGPAITFKKGVDNLFDRGGYINWFGRTYHKEIKVLKKEAPHAIEYMTGAAMLIKKEIFKKIGLFDESFFLYYEDVDFCQRAKKAGFDTFIDPNVSIVHLLSKTTGKMSPLSVYHQTKSALLFGQKYFKNPFAKVVNRLFIFIQTAIFFKKNQKSGLAGIKAIQDYYFSKKNILISLFLLLLSTLSFISFWKVFSFDFWIDDWYLIWASLYNFSASHWYFNHPGLPFEFYVLSHIFGLHILWWQIYNLALKIIVAYLVGRFTLYIIKSKSVSFLSAVFFAVSYVGFEAISSPIMNVAALVSIPLLLSFIFISHLKANRKSSVMWLLLTLLVSFILDPARVIPLFFIFPFYIYLTENKIIKFNVLNKKVISLLIISVIIFLIWAIHFESSSQIAIALSDLFHHDFTVFNKVNRVGNLFAAIGNMWTGLLYPLPQDPQNTATYIRWVGIVGLLFFITGMVTFVQFLRSKNRSLGMISFFIIWIFLFYIPNWLSEPRAPMAGPHRYLFISSIGFCCLIAYLLVQLKNKLLILILSILFIVLNIFQANRILDWQASYRSKAIVEHIWNTVIKDVHLDNKQMIFVFYGEEPWLHQIVDLSGASPFMLKKHLGADSPTPIFTRDPQIILSYICSNSAQVSLSHIYGWNITKNGGIESISSQVRESVSAYAKQHNCLPKVH